MTLKTNELDILIKSKDTGFFIAKEPNNNWLVNSIFGCSKKHKNIKFLIERMIIVIRKQFLLNFIEINIAF